MKIFAIILLISFASSPDIFGQEYETPVQKHFNFDLDLGGNSLLTLNATYYWERFGVMTNIPRIFDDHLFFVVGTKYNLTDNKFKIVPYARPKADIFLGLNYGYIYYPPLFSKYVGYALWSSLELNFEFMSGFNFYVRGGAGFISDRYEEKTIGIIMVPEFGFGYRF